MPAQSSGPPSTLPQGASSPKVATDSAVDTQPQQQTQQQQPQQQQQQQQEQPPPQQQQPAAHSSPPAGENAMNVVLVGAECAPWSKTGETVRLSRATFRLHDIAHAVLLQRLCASGRRHDTVTTVTATVASLARLATSTCLRNCPQLVSTLNRTIQIQAAWATSWGRCPRRWRGGGTA